MKSIILVSFVELILNSSNEQSAYILEESRMPKSVPMIDVFKFFMIVPNYF